MRDGWTKKQRRELRKLSELAWKRELDKVLDELHGDFEAWENEEISGFELSERIHEFHKGPARELYNRYSSGPVDLWIGRAIAEGLIAESELSDELHDALKDDVAHFRKHLADSKSFRT